MYRYSMTQWIAGNEDMDQSMQRLKDCGYDGIEFAAEPYALDGEELRRKMDSYGLCCTSLCGIFSEERDLSSGDETVAQRAVQYVKDSVDLAVKVGAPLMIIVPSPVGRTAPPPGCSHERAWRNAVKNVRLAAEYAAGRHVVLAVEAINRYETYLVNTMEKNLKFVRETAHPGVRMMADCFHMSLEERDILQSLRMAAHELVHVHIADNTREAAGMGRSDFKGILRTLREIGYEGSLTMEFLPRIANPYAAQDMDSHAKLMDAYAKQSIEYMKIMEASIT